MTKNGHLWLNAHKIGQRSIEKLQNGENEHWRFEFSKIGQKDYRLQM